MRTVPALLQKGKRSSARACIRMRCKRGAGWMRCSGAGAGAMLVGTQRIPTHVGAGSQQQPDPLLSNCKPPKTAATTAVHISPPAPLPRYLATRRRWEAQRRRVLRWMELAERNHIDPFLRPLPRR